MAGLEDGGTVEVKNGRLEVKYGGVQDDVSVDLANVDEVSFTRPSRSDLHGAVVVKAAGDEVVMKVREDEALGLVAEVRAGMNRDDVDRYENEGGLSE